jgi:3-hydroxyacyl-CoA dehydrogenase
MPDFVLKARDGSVLILTLNNPPVNALGPGVPEQLAAEVQAGALDPEVEAIVVIGGGRTFIAGFDIKEFARITSGERESIDLAAQILQIENCPKPVVMALHGSALGGGLEVAMGGHYRVAAATAQLGQPEVKLGLIPGAGGTQRLPRLGGIDLALEMCAFGEPIGAGAALAAGIVDRIVEGDLLAGAVEFAREAIRLGPRPTRARDAKLRRQPADLAERIEEWKDKAAKRWRGHEAPLAAIDAVFAATYLSFEEGIAYERGLFTRLLFGSQSKALIHVFFGERTVAKIPNLATTVEPLPIARAAVVGAGTMGGGIAMNYANAGVPVLLKESSPEALERGLANIRRNYESSVRKGRLDAAEMQTRMSLITPVLTYDGFETADIITEAVFEDLELKKRIFAELDQVARPGAVLATNTSTLDLDRIAAATRRPEWVLGHHYFSPANVMRLLEVVRGTATSPQVIKASMDLARRLNKVAVVAGNAMGFIGNRMFGPYRQQAVMMVEEGATPDQVDLALTEFGMAMGPLAVGDLAGLDVSWRVRQSWKQREQPGVRYAEVEDLLYERGRYGQKTGAGWYRYDEQRRAHADPEVESLVREYAVRAGIPQRKFTAHEIVERCLRALVEEGRKLLAEGVALRPVDIDIVYVHGYGFPSWRGGPMFWADIR